MSGSVGTGTEDDENWLDIDDNVSLPTLSLDDVMKQVDSLDDSFMFSDMNIEDDASIFRSSSSHGTPVAPSYVLDCPLRCTVLEGISHQLRLAQSRAGRATAVARHRSRMAIVTSRGLLLVFDEKNQRPLFSVFSDEKLGSASSVTFSRDGNYVAVGYSKGGVKILNAKSGSVVYTIGEAVQPGKGVLQVVFLSGHHALLALDNGGSVFEIRIRRNLTGRKTEQIRCVFSGCNGEVVYIQLLKQYNLLALVSLTKVLLVSTSSGGSILCAFPIKGSPEMPPLLDFVKTGSGSEVLLAIGRDNRISLYKLFPRRVVSKSSAAVRQIRTVTCDRPLIALVWMSEHYVLCVDDRECVSILNVSSSTLSTLPDPLDMKLVYATADFKGLATGGEVSAAMSCLSENVCYASVSGFDETAVVLGGESVFYFSLVSEREQLEAFEERKDYTAACLYVLDVIKGKVSLKSKPFKDEVEKVLPSLLRSLVDWTLDGLCGGRVADLVAHYRKHIDVLLRVCSGAERMDVFYYEAYPRLERDMLCRSVVLDLLDEYVLDGLLVEPPPALVSDYLKNLIQEGHFCQLQAAVVRIPIHCIDLHAVISACRSNNLYDGIIYVSNKALLDFLGPLEEMLDNVSHFSSRDLRTDSEIEIGNKLMLYLHCCLAGNAYPFGTLPEDLLETVPLQVFRCITSLSGKNGVESINKYPYLKLLLQFDAQQFLHVICTCADAPLFATDNRLQRIIELIGLLSVESNSEHILSQYLLCISHLVVHARCIPQTSVIEEAIESLLKLPSLSVDSELSVVDVLRNLPDISLKRPLQLAQRNPVKPKICSYIFTVQRRFIDLVNCFIVHNAEPHELFDVIRTLLRSDLTSDEFDEFAKHIRENIPRLCEISARMTASLVLEHFLDYAASLRLQPGTALSTSIPHFPLLRCCFELRREKGEHVLTSDEEIDESLFTIVVYGMCTELDSKELDRDLSDWLRYWLPLGSRSDQCLNLAAEKEATASCVMLLEARGHHQRAFELLERRLREAISTENEEELFSSIDAAVSLCSSHPEMSQQNGWLISVFHLVTQTVGEMGNSRDSMRSRVFSLANRILEGGSEMAAELLECLYQTPFFADAEYSEHSAFLLSILNACSFDVTVMEDVLKCQDIESAGYLANLENCVSARVSRPVTSVCAKCERPIDTAAFVFNCGHVVHMECDEGGEKICPCERSSSWTQPSWSSHLCAERRIQKRDIFARWEEGRVLTPQGEVAIRRQPRQV